MATSVIVAGIDPGLEGALAVIYPPDERGTVEIVWFDTPVYRDGKRRRIDFAGCAKLLREHRELQIHVFIEKVQSSPQMGVTSAFSFGQGYGAWLGILAALEIPFTLVTPQRWKKALMDGEPKEKDASRIVARRLYPEQTEEALSLRRHGGRADATLIAEFGRRQLLGKIEEK
jgi:crossover junction endodeoxyribonuclease RuvC